MIEPERHGVQGLTLESNKALSDLFRRSSLFGISCGIPRTSTMYRPTTSAATIDWISDQGMSDMSHMHSNLVSAPSCQGAFDQGRHSAECLQHPVAGQRRFATGYDGHLLSVGRTAADIALDLAPGGGGHAENDGLICTAERPVGKLRRECGVRKIVLGDHHQPAGVLVQPVDDPRPADAADARQPVAAVPE